MTYPEGLPSVMQPTDLHDATWGILAAVYGGAIHPTAEGHAAMADAALPAVREALALRRRAAPPLPCAAVAACRRRQQSPALAGAHALTLPGA